MPTTDSIQLRAAPETLVPGGTGLPLALPPMAEAAAKTMVSCTNNTVVGVSTTEGVGMVSKAVAGAGAGAEAEAEDGSATSTITMIGERVIQTSRSRPGFLTKPVRTEGAVVGARCVIKA